MKRTKIIVILLLAVLTGAMTSCEKDEVNLSEPWQDTYDNAFSFTITPIDAEGNNLIKNGTITPDDLWLEYDGMELKCNEDADIDSTEPIKFFGLRLTAYEPQDIYSFIVGNFSGNKNYVDVKMKLHWSDGSVDDIEMNHYHVLVASTEYSQTYKRISFFVVNGVYSTNDPVLVKNPAGFAHDKN